MNRAQRRNYEKILRHAGATKAQAKATANQYIADTFKEGDKVRFNYELCVRNPQWKLQKDEFRDWVMAHKDVVLTVAEARYNGTEVTFVEDEQEEKFWHKTITLLPVATATIKLDDGTEKKIAIEDTNNIMGEINKAMEGDENVSSN